MAKIGSLLRFQDHWEACISHKLSSVWPVNIHLAFSKSPASPARSMRFAIGNRARTVGCVENVLTTPIIPTSTWCSSSKKLIVTDTQDHDILASINFFRRHQEDRKKKKWAAATSYLIRMFAQSPSVPAKFIRIFAQTLVQNFAIFIRIRTYLRSKFQNFIRVRHTPLR